VLAENEILRSSDIKRFEMIENIDHPAAIVSLRWLSGVEGGRRSGPPEAPVYAATCIFPLGGETETMPGWPATAPQISILVQRLGTEPALLELAKVAFLVPDLAKPHLSVDAKILVMEGPRPVAHGVIQEVF